MKTRVEVAMNHSKRAESEGDLGQDAARRRRRSNTWAAAISAALVGLACGSRLDGGLHSTDTGNPPFIDSAGITAQLEAGTILVEGTPGAVPAGAQVRVRNETRDTSSNTTAADDGSFDVSVAGEGGDTVVVRVEVGSETASVTLDVLEEAPASTVNPLPETTDEFASGSTAVDNVPVVQTDAGVPLDPSAPRSLTPREVDWANVDWQNSTTVDLTDAGGGPGLWMGTDRGEGVEIEPPYAVAEASGARRFSGVAPTTGGYSYYHIAAPMERYFDGVYLNARSRAAGGQTVRVTIGGAVEEYWSYVNNGAQWPVWELELGANWTKHELTFSELGFDAEHLSPYSDPWGALHFLIPAEQAYDFEIFDLLFVSLSSE